MLSISLLSALAAHARAAEDEGSIGDFPRASDWVRMPSRLSPAIAAGALAKRQAGVAVVRCQVSAAGNVSGCRLVTEFPVGYHFGEAALRLSPQILFKPPNAGGPAAGRFLNIPFHFDGPVGPQPKYYLRVGDGAVLITPLKAARPPGREVIDCPAGENLGRYCLWTFVRWTERPSVGDANLIIRQSDLDSGISRVSCVVGPDGRLGDCQVSGASSTKVVAVAQALSARFQTSPTAQDGTPLVGRRIDYELNWTLLRPLAGPFQP